MEAVVPLMAIIAIFIVFPAIVFGYLRDVKRDRLKLEKSADAQTGSVELERLAERMERRIESLEKILDAEAPGWRNRHG
ncbi:MAG TPA: hypothetical protein VFV27_01585 [Nevskiaceae bacterium]|nr:hypothetical protein [Nevskiaceae bacterium]